MIDIYKSLKYVYNIIYLIAMSVAAQLIIDAYTGYPYMTGVIVISTVLTAVLYQCVSAFLQSKRGLFVSFIIVYLLCVIGVVGAITPAALEQYVNLRFLSAIVAYINDSSGLLVTLLMASSVTIICGLVSEGRYSRLFGTIIIIAVIVAARLYNIPVTLEATVLVIYIGILSWCRISDSENYLYLTPIIVVFCIMIYIIPTKDKPMSWGKLGTMAEQVKDNVSEVWQDVLEATGLDNSTSKAGYSDSYQLQLSDKIVGNEKTQISVEGTQTASGIYLIGAYYNIYTGNNWERRLPHNKDENYPEHEITLFETVNRIMNSYKSDASVIDNVFARDVKITYEGLSSSTVFLPKNMIYTNIEETRYSNGVLRHPEVKVEGDSYRAWYLSVNKSMDKVTYGDSAYSIRYNKPEDIVKFAEGTLGCDIIGNMDIDLILDMSKYLYGREKYVKENYSKVPPVVPSRVKDLAERITKDCKADDYSKAKALEQYLSENYEYDMDVNPEDHPVGEEYCEVDDFLFKNKRGSCMHFASALAMLARCIGIPSRLVTGYYAHFDENKGERVVHYVSGSEGHAWPEVYLGKAGWLALEPTPSYSNTAYAKERTKSEHIIIENIQAYESTQVVVTDETDTATESPAANSSSAPTKTPSDSEGDTPDSSTHNSISSGIRKLISSFGDINTELLINILRFVMATFTICIIIVLIGWLAMKRIRYRRYGTADKCSRIISIIMRKYERFEAKNGRKISMSDVTLNESVELMGDWLGDDKEEYARLVKEYQAGVFGGRRIRRSIVKCGEKLIHKL